MKIYNKIILALLMISFLASCDLDTKPYQSIDVDQLTSGDVETITLGTYGFMKSDNGIMRATHYFGEYGSDNVSLSGSSSDPLKPIWNYLRTTNNSRIANIWEYSYKTIININTALEVAKEGQSQEMDMIIGENYYLRAFHYFTIGNVFGRPYSHNPTLDPSVPLKLTTSMDDFPARSTVAEVYDRVEKDLLKAIEMMTYPAGSTATPKNSCYASKEVAEALLSRVYLYMENWELAEKYATNVITSGRYQLLEADKFVNYPTYVPEQNNETIFAVRYTKDVDYKADYRPYMIGSMYAKIDGDGWGEMFTSDAYLKLLELHPTDLRKAFIKKQVIGDGSLWFIYNKNNSYVMVPVTKTGDTYTMVDSDGYNSAIIATEAYHGGTAYTVTTTDNVKYYGRVEEQCKVRNGYPEYFIYKCSLQEGQAQLWSPVISRLAEMYLNRAEARVKNTSSNLSGALADINVIRERAKIPKWTTANIPVGSSVLDLVLEERQLELAYEAHRRHDIYRNKRNLNRNYPGSHHSDGAPSTVLYTDNAVVEYIPLSEITKYPNSDLLIQNP